MNFWTQPQIIAGQQLLGSSGGTSQLAVQIDKTFFEPGYILYKDPVKVQNQQAQAAERYLQNSYNGTMVDFVLGNNAIARTNFTSGLSKLSPMRGKTGAISINTQLLQEAVRTYRAGGQTPELAQRIAAGNLIQGIQQIESSLKILNTDDGSLTYNQTVRQTQDYQDKQLISGQQQQLLSILKNYGDDPQIQMYLEGQLTFEQLLDGAANDVDEATQRYQTNPTQENFQEVVAYNGILLGYNQLPQNMSKINTLLRAGRNDQYQTYFTPAKLGDLAGPGSISDPNAASRLKGELHVASRSKVAPESKGQQGQQGQGQGKSEGMVGSDGNEL